jgi:hypothetical protein
MEGKGTSSRLYGSGQAESEMFRLQKNWKKLEKRVTNPKKVFVEIRITPRVQLPDLTFCFYNILSQLIRFHSFRRTNL